MLSRQDPEQYVVAASSHVITAAKYAIQGLTQIDEKVADSPQLTRAATRKFEEPEVKEFTKFYIALISKGLAPKRTEVTNALNKVRAFLVWVKKYRTEA